MSELIVSALQMKRAELAARITQDTKALAALEIVLTLYETQEPRWCRSGVTRLIVEIVRDAPKPLTMQQIAAALAKAKGAPDAPQRFVSRAERVLYKLRLRRLVETVDIGGRSKGWRITDAVSGDMPES